MTSHELAKLLLAQPDQRVVIQGYEGGFDDIEGIEKMSLMLDTHKNDSYHGPHEDANGDYANEAATSVVVPAFLITATEND